ncbi:glycosyltransferase family 2 protein [Paenibacillus jiagnxiensis]|uniref:glycosyltransferase family 2 protein n=1 Tax=Paenibacillus jiagnxiensis TaxID=3228926 RepID=UPI0033B8FB06
MEKPSISLCMIVRNEEKYLPQCLRSVQRIVDEIIIVDTGSTDDTVAIAQAYGAKVIQMPWQGSFADARNRSFDEATGDWILWLDADEEMDVEEAGKLKELLTRGEASEPGIEGLLLVVSNLYEGGLEYNSLLRMVRNRPQYRFEGRIHEQILPNMLKFTPDLTIGQIDIHVYHHGYLPQNIADKDKIRRNTTLLRQAMLEQPDAEHYLYFLGVELFRSRDLKGALDHFNEFLSKQGDFGIPLLSNAHKYRLGILADMGRYDDLVRHSTDSIAQFPGFTDLYHLQSIGYVGLGEIDKAIRSLQQALKTGPAEQGYPSIVGFGTYLTCRDLGLLFESADKPEEADICFTLAALKVDNRRMTVSS